MIVDALSGDISTYYIIVIYILILSKLLIFTLNLYLKSLALLSPVNLKNGRRFTIQNYILNFIHPNLLNPKGQTVPEGTEISKNYINFLGLKGKFSEIRKACPWTLFICYIIVFLITSHSNYSLLIILQLNREKLNK